MSASSSQNGDVSPRTKTKWKRKEDATQSTAVRISNPNQFVPTNTDPRHVLAIRKSIRGQGRKETNKPGPQSQLLHSVSPDRSAVGDNERIVTSSKGIIQRGEEVVLVAPAGPPNPFNEMTQDDLKKYQQQVLKGEEPETTSPPEETASPPQVEEVIEEQAPVEDASTEVRMDVEESMREQIQEDVVLQTKEVAALVIEETESRESTPNELVVSSPSSSLAPSPAPPVPDDPLVTRSGLPGNFPSPNQSAVRSDEDVIYRNTDSPGSKKKMEKKKKRSSLSFLKKKKQKE
uniref:Uncharacterized protein n=2 Tax=Ciona savignyi TaxID=51511 RepID=H2ZJG7_CIOSA